jgi:hypothetical protein
MSLFESRLVAFFDALLSLTTSSILSAAAICALKQHEAIPAKQPRALDYAAILCSDISGVLNTTNPLCNVLGQRQAAQGVVERQEDGNPPPPILLACAPNFVPSLASGAQNAASDVSVIWSDLTPEEEAQVISPSFPSVLTSYPCSRPLPFLLLAGGRLQQRSIAR